MKLARTKCVSRACCTARLDLVRDMLNALFHENHRILSWEFLTSNCPRPLGAHSNCPLTLFPTAVRALNECIDQTFAETMIAITLIGVLTSARSLHSINSFLWKSGSLRSKHGRSVMHEGGNMIFSSRYPPANAQSNIHSASFRPSSKRVPPWSANMSAPRKPHRSSPYASANPINHQHKALAPIEAQETIGRGRHKSTLSEQVGDNLGIPTLAMSVNFLLLK